MVIQKFLTIPSKPELMSLRARLSRRKPAKAKRTVRTRKQKTTRSTRGRRRKTEMKVVDTDITATVGYDQSATAGGTGYAYTVLLNGIASGSDVNERIGRKANMRFANLALSILPSAGTLSTDLHVAIVLDKVPSGTLPPANLLYGPEGLRVLDNTPRFRVLSHQTFNFRPTTVGATVVDASSRRYMRTVPLNFMTSWNAVGDTLGAISGNALYLVAWSSENRDVSIAGKFRLRFSEE